MAYHYKKKTKEEVKKEVADLSGELQEGVIGYYKSDRYHQLLDTMSQFHGFSLNNCLLIALQRPTATICASYTDWQRKGQQVKSGEKGIKIFCPVKYQTVEEKEKKDENGVVITDPFGHVITEKVLVNRISFKLGYTYDIGQTTPKPGCKPLDLTPAHRLEGSVEDYNLIKNAIVHVADPTPIYYGKIDGEANGYFKPSSNTIIIRQGMSDLQTIKTMLHETAHSQLHNKDAIEKIVEAGGQLPSKSDEEVQAESVAYIACKHLGLNTDDYSFPYIANWADNFDSLEKNLKVIKNCADKLINGLDEYLAESITQKEEKMEFCDADGIKDYLKNYYKNLVYVDDGMTEVIAKKEDLPSIIVDQARKTPGIYLSVFDFNAVKHEPIMTSTGYILESCSVENIHDMQSKIDDMLYDPSKIKSYSVIDEDAYEDLIYNAKEVSAAYDDGRVMYVQESDEGYDYTYYFSDGCELDGGKLDNPDLNILDALDEVEEIQDIKTERKSLVLDDGPEEILGEDYLESRVIADSFSLAKAMETHEKFYFPDDFKKKETYKGANFDSFFSDILHGNTEKYVQKLDEISAKDISFTNAERIKELQKDFKTLDENQKKLSEKMLEDDTKMKMKI